MIINQMIRNTIMLYSILQNSLFVRNLEYKNVLHKGHRNLSSRFMETALL